jgi:hypothetical protein
VAQEPQQRLDGHVGRRRVPVLAALDEQRRARVVLVVEERVIAQPPAGGMTAVDDDVLGRPERAREREALAPQPGQGKRRTRLRHRMQVEQHVDAVVERTKLARAAQLRAVPRAIEHLRGPQSVEVLVDAPRRERIRPVEAPVGGDIGEHERERAARRAQSLAQRPVERDGAADLVAVGQRLHQGVWTGARRAELPDERQPGIARCVALEIGKRNLDRRRARGRHGKRAARRAQATQR